MMPAMMKKRKKRTTMNPLATNEKAALSFDSEPVLLFHQTFIHSLQSVIDLFRNKLRAGIARHDDRQTAYPAKAFASLERCRYNPGNTDNMIAKRHG